VMIGFPLADPIIGLVITIAIAVVLKGAATDVFRRLMDAVDPALIDQARDALTHVDGVRHVERVQMRWLGHTLHAEAVLAVDEDTSLHDAHDLAHQGERALRDHVARLDSATVHVHPAHVDSRV
jgi:divalent metal cation (Fe/Co/Zn/Cd) transporter